MKNTLKVSLLSFGLLSSFLGTVYASDPVEIGGIVTKDIVANEKGIAGSISGKSATLTIGTVGSATNTTPSIKSDIGKVVPVMGSFSDKKTSLDGGRVVLNSGEVGDIYGGYILNLNDNQAEVSNSSILINGGDSDQSEYGGIFGALASSVPSTNVINDIESKALKNKVDIHNGVIDAKVAGGTAYIESSKDVHSITGNANENVVSISGGTINGEVYGGYSYALSNNGNELVTTIANRNAVTIDNASFKQQVKGAYSTATTDNGTAISYANNNTLILKNGIYTESNAADSSAMSNGVSGNDKYSVNIAYANDNTLIMQGGTSKSLSGAYSFADHANTKGSAETYANNNKVTLENGNVDTGAFFGTIGGMAMASQDDANGYVLSEANGNSYTVNNGMVKVILSGGMASSDSWGTAKKAQATASNNIVTINKGIVKNIRGGYAKSSTSNGGPSTAISNNNTVMVNDGSFETLVGGMAIATSGDTSATSFANNNHIIINGGTIANNSSIIGGAVNSSNHEGSKSIARDNTIEIHTNFNAPTVSIYGGAILEDDMSMGADIPTEVLNNSLKVVASNVVIKNIHNLSSLDLLPSQIISDKPVIKFEDSNAVSLNNMIVRVVLPSDAPKEGRLLMSSGPMSLAGTQFNVESGISIPYTIKATDTTLDYVLPSSPHLDSQTNSLVSAPFAAFNFLKNGLTQTLPVGRDAVLFNMNHNTHSVKNINTTGNYLNLGVQHDKYFIVGQYGKGSYNAMNSEGDIDYKGVAIVGEHKLNNGVLLKGGLQVGRSHVSFTTHSLTSAGIPVGISFGSNATYYGINFGANKRIWKEDNKSFMIYGNYFYTKQGKMYGHIQTGEVYTFPVLQNHMIQFGGIYTVALSPKTKLFTGIKLQYEHGTDAYGEYKGLKTDSISDNGFTFNPYFGVSKRFHKQGMISFNFSRMFGVNKGNIINGKLSYKF